MPRESIADGAAVVQEILAYAGNILRVRPGLSRCPVCDAVADGPAFFRRHGIRGRTFWVIVERLVRKVPCRVTQWKCRCCKGTFTLQPPFALRHRRYTLGQMLERAERYAGDHATGYREAVKQKGMPVCHEQCSDGARDRTAAEQDSMLASRETCETSRNEEDGTERQLRHSTLYRWVTTLGGWTRTVQRALRLIRQKDAATALLRDLAGLEITATKFRSEARERTLRTCRALSRVARVYEAMFGANLFPLVGTASGWT